MFESLEPRSAPNAMQIASGHVLHIEGIGSINLSSDGEINMNNIFYVPGLTSNLMYVGYIIDKDFVVVFDNSQCLVYKGGTREVVGGGIRDQHTSLYRYIVEHPRFPICAIQSSEVGQLWHHRMEHLNPHSLRSMGSKGVATGLPLISGSTTTCESCYEGKQSRHPTPKIATRCADKPFMLIYSDLSGMIQQPSLAGSHYLSHLSMISQDLCGFFYEKEIRNSWIFSVV